MIKIEVTGGSIPEVADKLLAIGRSLMGVSSPQTGTGAVVTVTPTDPVMPEVAEAAAPKRTRRKATDPVPSGNETAADTATGTGSTTETEVAAPPVEETPTEATPASPAEPEIDFTNHVMPAVLRAVEQHGREAVEAVLTEFGVGRASQLPEAQWGELITRIEDIG